MSNNKKVLYITYDGMTDPLGQSQVLPYLVGLSKKGYEFTILSFEKKDRYLKQKAIIETITAAAGIRWVPMSFTAKPPLLSKMYDVMQMRSKATSLHRQYGFAMIHCRSYVPVSAVLSLCKKESIPLLFDMRGLWVDERVDNGQWSLKNPVYKFAYTYYKRKEKEYFKGAAQIISLTERGKKELTENYAVPPEKIAVIPCCVDLALFDYKNISAEQKEALRSRLGIPPTNKVLTYLGSLGGWYLTTEMIDFFAELKKTISNLTFLFITHNKKEEIEQLALSRGVDPGDIVVQPAARLEVPALLSLSDWSIFFIKDAYSKRASSPTKQGEIMAMGIPLICNDIGDTGKIVLSAGAGIIIENFLPADYKKAADRIKELDDLQQETIRQAAFDYYDLGKGIADYLKVYNKLLS